MNLLRHFPTRLSGSLLVLMLITLVCAPVAAADAPPGSPPGSAEQAVRRAWEAARDAGTYQFASDVVQTTYPTPALSNVGRSLTRNELHLEGDVDLPGRALEMRLWTNGGSVANPDSAAEMRIEGEQAWIRQSGGSWQEVEDFTGGFAPGGDFMSYLVGAKNVKCDDVMRDGVSRFTFDFDGPAFAAYMRDQMEQILRERGELPLNLHLDSSRAYQGMTGGGEVTLDDRGLPLRLTIHLVYPPEQDSERVEADLDTSFAFDAEQVSQAQAAGGVTGAAAVLRDIRQSPGKAAQYPLFIAFAVLCCAALILARRSQKTYRVVVVLVILSMVVVPLLQADQTLAFVERQKEKTAQHEQQGASQDATTDVGNPLIEPWDPHQDPLQAIRNGSAELAAAPAAPPAVTTITRPASVAGVGDQTDSDGDGLTDVLEGLIKTDPLNADSDGDTLDDGIEVRLGTNPIAGEGLDSDGDGIHDNIEIRGFVDANGRRWYLNPKQTDTNGDGVDDGVECFDLRDISTLDAAVDCDSDGDGTPDPFDLDDDGDGVVDQADLTPTGSLGRDGNTFDPAAPMSFDREHPFSLKLEGLTTNTPTLVDIQLRTENAEHLTYAMNVLDWPREDLDGQIQHAKLSTFASHSSAEQAEVNPRLANGDMRLIPMLEVEMPGDQEVLAMTRPEVDITLTGAITGSVHLSQHETDATRTQLHYTFEEAAQYTVTIHQGACPPAGNSLPGSYQTVSSGITTTLGIAATLLCGRQSRPEHQGGRQGSVPAHPQHHQRDPPGQDGRRLEAAAVWDQRA